MTVSYVVILVCCITAAFAFRLRVDGIFSCPADGYREGGYLAYCQASDYGEYDRGAFWYGLQPEARLHAAAAEVLFLGSSRMQFAFSTPATAEWFAAAGADHYLLGFSHTENLGFAEPLLARLAPRPRAYVINVDHFFDDRLTAPTRALLQDGDARTRYRQKQLWQDFHQPACAALPALCGNQLSFFRETRHGTWQLRGSAGLHASGVSDAPAEGRERWSHYQALAARFLATLPVDRQCIFLTIAPYDGTNRAEAAAIAAAVGFELIAPQVPGLRTFDGSHLDAPSAERWSRAFYETAGPRLRGCLGKA